MKKINIITNFFFLSFILLLLSGSNCPNKNKKEEEENKGISVDEMMSAAKQFSESNITYEEIESKFNKIKIDQDKLKELFIRKDQDSNTFLFYLRKNKISNNISQIAKDTILSTKPDKYSTDFSQLDDNNKNSLIGFIVDIDTPVQDWMSELYKTSQDDIKKYIKSTMIMDGFMKYKNYDHIIKDADKWGFDKDLFKDDFAFGPITGKLAFVLAKTLDLKKDADKNLYKEAISAMQRHFSGNWFFDYVNINLIDLIKPLCGANVGTYECPYLMLSGDDPKAVLKIGFSYTASTKDAVKEAWEFFIDHADKARFVKFFNIKINMMGSGIAPSATDYVWHNLAHTQDDAIVTEITQKLIKKAKEFGLTGPELNINAKNGDNRTALYYARVGNIWTPTKRAIHDILVSFGATE